MPFAGRAASLLWLICAGCCVAANVPEGFVAVRAERKPVSGGAEVITYFQRIPTVDGTISELPLLAVLNDTLGLHGADNDRLRQVWVFTYHRPNLLHRLSGAVPFLYTRAPLPHGASSQPVAAMDMGAPTRRIWKDFAETIVQTQALDPIGAVVRLVSRSYSANIGEYERMHVWQALDVLAAAPVSEFDGGLTEQQMQSMQGRLELSSRLLGGLVSDEYLDRAYLKNRTRRMEARAANWDLLRQKAEENGLYFQPVSIAGLPVSWAMLWVAQQDAAGPRTFDSQFLGIGNPFGDSSLKKWSGYSETWWLDASGSPVAPGTPEAREVRMIPLALYALDHPRTPFLLADMRRSGRPKRSEMIRRFSTDVTVGILGWTGYGRWSYLAAKGAYSFVRSRHGVPMERSARLRAYVQVRHALAADETLNPDLRRELAKRIDALNINPLEHDWNREVRAANDQYAAFLEYVESPSGLSRELAADREQELSAARHSVGRRLLFGLGTVASAGIYRHHETVDQTRLAELAERRRQYWAQQRDQLPPAPPVVLAGGGVAAGTAQ